MGFNCIKIEAVIITITLRFHVLAWLRLLTLSSFCRHHASCVQALTRHHGHIVLANHLVFVVAIAVSVVVVIPVRLHLLSPNATVCSVYVI